MPSPSTHTMRAGSTAPRSCYWAQAGVVKHKVCNRDFHCHLCPYDRALRQMAAANAKAKKHRRTDRPRHRIEYWTRRMRKLPALQRPCIHSMQGAIDFRPCTEDYHCAECEFHHYFQDVFTVHTQLTPVALLESKGFHLPQGYYLHPGHAWAKLESENMVRIGLDELCTRILGPVDSIKAPLLGKRVQQGKPVFILSRAGEEVMVLAPISGVVTDINPVLTEDPGQVMDHPYTSGWLIRVQASDLRSELHSLHLGAESAEFVGQEVDRVFDLVQEVYGPLAADGGELVPDLATHLPGVSWEQLAGLILDPGSEA